MHLSIQYEDRSGVPRTVWIRQHEVVTFGSEANEQVHGDREIDRIHFQLHFEQDVWMLQSVSDRPLKLNGQYTRISVLQNGDQILAGRTVFSVSLPQTSQNPPAIEEVTDTDSVETPNAALNDWWRGLSRRESKLPADVTEYQIDAVGEHFRELLPYFHIVGPTVLVWNRKAFGNPTAQLAGWTIAEEDVFAQAPEEIRNHHSLAVGSIDWGGCDIDQLGAVLKSDSAQLLFHSSDASQLIERKKVMWGWFAKPSLLQFHLRNGSAMLISNLVHPEDVIAMVPRNGDSLVLYGQPDRLMQLSVLRELS